jgi:hypothetical protein
MVAVVVALVFIVGILALLVAGLLRSHAEILRALHDLGINLDPSDLTSGTQSQSVAQPRLRPGIPSPRAGEVEPTDIIGVDISNEALSVAIVGTGRLTLLAFLSSSCLTCRGFWKDLDNDRVSIPGGARPVIVAKGFEAESESALRDLAPRNVTTIMSSAGWSDYEVPVAPYFVLVDGATDSIVGEGAAATWAQLENLMSQSMADLGLAFDREQQSSSKRTFGRRGADRAARVDQELRAAGLEPGDARLYQVDRSSGELDR